ncbi:hypothetical protein LOAG_11545 [Loa loa]|nr:hypothetical protein LOAG_11545 [Loa loa]EFO16957.1 hypothetical protein LOAG_11545 [Loa loa]
MEYPLDTVKIVDLEINTAPQLTNTTFTTVTTCCNSTTTTSTITTAANDAVNSTKNVAQLSIPETPMQMQVLEQKIVTETKTLTTRSTITSLPAETPVSLNVAPIQSTNPITPSAIVQLDQQPVLEVSSNAANAIIQQNDSINPTTTVEVHHSTVEENAVDDQEPSITIQIENDAKDQIEPNIKSSTTTIINSSDKQLKRWPSITESNSSEFRKTQSEHGRQLLVTQNNNVKEKMPPTTDELRDALKELASTKPPTKRLTEKQKEKLSASCGHLHIQDDNEMKDGSIRQLLASTRYESRRKLSSISEKSIEMMSGGGQLKPAPSSISCPTTTRISKDHGQLPRTLQRYRDSAYGIWNCFFTDLMVPLSEELTNVSGRTKTVPIGDNSTARNSCRFTKTLPRSFNPVGCSKLERNRTSTTMKHRMDSDTSSSRQRPISIVDSRPPWNFSPFKDGDLDRIAPLQPYFPHSSQPRKWLSALHLNDEHATTLRSNRQNISRRRQSDWNLHDVSHARIMPASHSARLHTRLSSAKVLRNSSGIKWTPNGTEDHGRLAKEQLWWDAH